MSILLKMKTYLIFVENLGNIYSEPFSDSQIPTYLIAKLMRKGA